MPYHITMFSNKTNFQNKYYIYLLVLIIELQNPIFQLSSSINYLIEMPLLTLSFLVALL